VSRLRHICQTPPEYRLLHTYNFVLLRDRF
jgi:hypothetical protein